LSDMTASAQYVILQRASVLELERTLKYYVSFSKKILQMADCLAKVWQVNYDHEERRYFRDCSVR